MGQQELELCPKKEALPRTGACEEQGSLAGEEPGNPTPREPVPGREEGGVPPTNTGGKEGVLAVRSWLKLSSSTWSETGCTEASVLAAQPHGGEGE